MEKGLLSPTLSQNNATACQLPFPPKAPSPLIHPMHQSALLIAKMSKGTPPTLHGGGEKEINRAVLHFSTYSTEAQLSSPSNTTPPLDQNPSRIHSPYCWEGFPTDPQDYERKGGGKTFLLHFPPPFLSNGHPNNITLHCMTQRPHTHKQTILQKRGANSQIPFHFT